MAGGITTLVTLAFTHDGWVVFAMMPIMVLGGIGVPALQSMATRLVSAEQQGRFQGVLQSAVSLSAVIAPLFF